MPIEWRPRGDIIFDANTGEVTPVIPTNTHGVAGAGLAKKAALAWPWWEAEYRAACSARRLSAGDVVVREFLGATPGTVVDAMTKDHWRDPSKIDAVIACAREIAEWAESDDFRCSAVGVPLLGAGLGGLDRDRVIDELTRAFGGCRQRIVIYAAQPARREPCSTVSTSTRSGRLALIR